VGYLYLQFSSLVYQYKPKLQERFYLRLTIPNFVAIRHRKLSIDQCSRHRQTSTKVHAFSQCSVCRHTNKTNGLRVVKESSYCGLKSDSLTGYVCMILCMYYVLCMYVYIMYVCMYVCMYYVCMYYVCIRYVCMYICLYVCIMYDVCIMHV
jgi:hypothetical protein